MRDKLLSSALMVAFVLTATTSAVAQSGQLAGTVRDTSLGELPGVTVVVSGLKLSATRTTKTDLRGRFVLGELPAANDYKVAFSLTSFQNCHRESVHIAAGQQTVVDVVVKLQSVPPQQASSAACGDVLTQAARNAVDRFLSEHRPQLDFEPRLLRTEDRGEEIWFEFTNFRDGKIVQEAPSTSSVAYNKETGMVRWLMSQ